MLIYLKKDHIQHSLYALFTEPWYKNWGIFLTYYHPECLTVIFYLKIRKNTILLVSKGSSIHGKIFNTHLENKNKQKTEIRETRKPNKKCFDWSFGSRTIRTKFIQQLKIKFTFEKYFICPKEKLKLVLSHIIQVSLKSRCCWQPDLQ